MTTPKMGSHLLRQVVYIALVVLVAASVVQSTPKPASAQLLSETPFVDVGLIDGRPVADAEVFDLGVWISDGLREALGGERAAVARVAIEVNNMNIAFANSNIDTRARLAHIDYVSDEVTNLNRADLDAVGVDVGVVAVGANAEEFGARCGGSGGNGSVLVRMIDDCVLTTAHEVGHRLGAGHCDGDDSAQIALLLNNWDSTDPANQALLNDDSPLTLMCKGGVPSNFADRSRRIAEFSPLNAAIANNGASDLIGLAPANLTAPSSDCLTISQSAFIVSCDGSPLVQEAEGTYSDLSLLATQNGSSDDRFFPVEDTTNAASGRYYLTADEAGDSHSFTFDVPTPGVYTLKVRARNLDRYGITKITAAGDTVRWGGPNSATWQYREIVELVLPAGATSIQFDVEQPGTAFDIIQLEPADVSALDTARAVHVTELVAAFETYASTNGNYNISGGSGNRGWGSVYINSSRSTSYANRSVTETLNDAGIAVATTPTAPLTLWEIAARPCNGRIAIFSGADNLTTSPADTQWWADNNCPTWYLNNGRPYFQLTEIPGD